MIIFSLNLLLQIAEYVLFFHLGLQGFSFTHFLSPHFFLTVLKHCSALLFPCALYSSLTVKPKAPPTQLWHKKHQQNRTSLDNEDGFRKYIQNQTHKSGNSEDSFYLFWSFFLFSSEKRGSSVTKQLLHRGFSSRFHTTNSNFITWGLVWYPDLPHNRLLPSPSLRVSEYSSSAVFAEQDAPQTTMQPPGPSHTHTHSCGRMWAFNLRLTTSNM